jgi:hypothetical protein
MDSRGPSALALAVGSWSVEPSGPAPTRHSSILPVTLSAHSTGKRWHRDSEPLVRSTGGGTPRPSRLQRVERHRSTSPCGAVYIGYPAKATRTWPSSRMVLFGQQALPLRRACAP